MVQTYDKQYIGREEAFEVMLERGIDRLPSKGREIVTCKSNAEKLAIGQEYDEVLGKDEDGYYLGRI